MAWQRVRPDLARRISYRRARIHPRLCSRRPLFQVAESMADPRLDPSTR